jgi:CYTH domain-containing protein
MSLEIERKFLCTLTYEEAKALDGHLVTIHSVYMQYSKEQSLRVVQDIYPDGKTYSFWTIKKATEDPMVRLEFEEQMPNSIFDFIANKNEFPEIKKDRFKINVDGNVWEVDFFKNYDFVIAELEFKNEEEAKTFNNFPSWIGKEVTEDPTYLNCNLAK